MTKEELRKSIDEIVNTILEKQESKEGENIEKSMPKDLPENAGEDKIKNGTPYTEKQKMYKKKKYEKEDKKDMKKYKEPKAAKEEKSEEVAKSEKPEKKQEVKEEISKAEAVEAKGESKDEKVIEKSEKESKELGELSKEEVELIKAWRTQEDEKDTEISKSTQDNEKVESLEKALKEENQELKKAISDYGDMIKSLNDKIEKISIQPAYDKRALDRLETVEKSNGGQPDISKSQVVNRMLDLQREGKGVSSVHIAEMEATGNVSDKNIKKLVMDSFKN